MSRNSSPEETYQRVLEVSLSLFQEKGYEHTSIQDIIDHLGGLTKGAIYYHFKSKEDILLAVVNRFYQEDDTQWKDVWENKEMTGLEKLKVMFQIWTDSHAPDGVLRVDPNLLKNPRMLALQLQSTMEESVPRFVTPIINQGIEDGSIQTEYPQELGEVILLLFNLWLNPMVFGAEPEVIVRRFRLLRNMLEGIGVELFDDTMEEKLLGFREIYNQNK